MITESLWLIPACLLVGGVIGFSGGVLGIGGGLFAIPLLGLILGYEQQAAQGTALIMVLPAVLLTVRKYHQRSPIDWRSASAGAGSSIIFTWVGAQIALGIDPWLLRRIYAGFVFLVALFYFRESLGRRGRQRPAGDFRAAGEVRRLWYFLVGIFAGLTGGVFGVGGSVLAVPLMTTLFRLRQTSAQALALTMIVPGTVVALMTYAWHGQAHGLVGIPLALGSLLCVPYGVRLAYALPEARLKLIFACMLLIIMALLLARGAGMTVLPDGWARRPVPGGALCVPARLVAVAQAEWFDPQRPGALAVGEGGRQAAWFVDGDHGAAVLRHYRRGGLRARLGRNAYFWLGEGRVRAWAEVRVLAHLRAAGRLVPEPLAAAYWRVGAFYRNAILIARIPGARALAGRLDQADPAAVARAILAMHTANVWHADLNAYNILFDELGQVWLIDFDRARIGVVSPEQRRKNLLRLRRSLVKVAGARGAQWWDALDGIYRQLSD